MMSFEDNIVLIDFKNMRRLTDPKGKFVDIRANLEDESIH
jgi:hypothetical protein